MLKTCSKCGVPTTGRRKTGLCVACHGATGANRKGHYGKYGEPRETGTCMYCHRQRLVPHGKDKRWFRCDYCNFILAEYDDGERWLGGTGADFRSIID